MRQFALAMIRLYQRFVSPYKGFCCAYRAHTGGPSCSMLGFRAIRRYGVMDGIGVLRIRLYRCGVAFRRFAPVAPLRSKQAGFCEVVELGSSAAYCVGDTACYACDFASTGKRKTEDEALVNLPRHQPPSLIDGDGENHQT